MPAILQMRSSQESAERNLSFAGELEIQRMVSLEKQGLDLTARRISDEIKDLRKRTMETIPKAVDPEK